MNTEIKVSYASGDTRVFIVSDETEQQILDGNTIIITTIHPNTGNEAFIVSAEAD